MKTKVKFIPSKISKNDFYDENILALSSPKYLKSIQEAREEYKKSEYFSHQDIFENEK